MNVLNWRVIEDGLFSSGQPCAADWLRLAADGLEVVVNLRPDAEQPGIDERADVERAGLEYHSLPIGSARDLGTENVTAFRNLLVALRGRPVLVHCGSGNRVGAMFALARGREPGVSVDAALDYGRRAGLSGLEPQVAILLRGAR
jgi:uncharacterized protein (TIGR01244 family)